MKLNDIRITSPDKKVVIPCGPKCHCAELQKMNKRNDVFITYRHIRPSKKSNEGGITFAILADLRKSDNRFLKFGWAICSPKDNFCKKEGRKLAYTRLKSRNNFDIINYTDKYAGSLLVFILKYIAAYSNDQRFDDLNKALDKYLEV